MLANPVKYLDPLELTHNLRLTLIIIIVIFS